MRAGKLKRRLRVEKPVPDNSIDGAGSGAWAPVADVWAEVQDMLPSRSESMDTGIVMATRRARVRMRWRGDITPDMRFVLEQPDSEDRVMEIISGPAELGWRKGLEFMVEDHTSAGNAS